MTNSDMQLDTIDVTDARHGAVGDGSTNDQPAIQSALDDAAEHGGVVLLPAGRTFRVGHLRVHGGTTLVIDGVLLQSDDPNTYGYDPAIGHDLPGGKVLPYHLGSRENLPLIHARCTSDVVITGSGEIRMTGGSDDTVINIAPIGFYRVDGYEISGLRIRDSHSWNVMLYTTTRGVVRGLDIASTYRNSDGICVLNSQQIEVVGNTMDIADDGIYVRTEYDSAVYRPDIHWYSMRWPVPSRQIVVRDNTIVSRTRGFAFIPWGAKAPDQNAIEISDVVVEGNRFEALLPVSSWTDDPTANGPYASRGAWQENAADYDNHVPIKNVTIVGNTCVAIGIPTAGSVHTELRHLARMTNFVNDLGLLSWPGTDHDPAALDAQLPNGDFELGGLAHWSSAGRVGVATPDQLSALPGDQLQIAAEERFNDPLAWGPTGHLSGVDGPARLYQGIGLKHDPSQSTTWYAFTLDVVAAPSGAVVSARVGNEVLAQVTVTPGMSAVSLRIPVTRTVNPVEVGVDVGDGVEQWALIRNAWIRRLDS